MQLNPYSNPYHTCILVAQEVDLNGSLSEAGTIELVEIQ